MFIDFYEVSGSTPKVLLSNSFKTHNNTGRGIILTLILYMSELKQNKSE